MHTEDPFDTHSPYERIEADRRSRLVIAVGRAAILFSIPMAILLGIVYRPQPSMYLMFTLLLVLGIIPTSLITIRFANRGKVDIAGFFFVIYMLSILAINTSIIAGLLPILIASYLLLIVIAGMIFKPIYSYSVGALSGLIFLLVRWYLNRFGATISLSETSQEITVAVTILFSFGFIAYLNQVSTKDLRDALDEATFNLLQANEQLELASERKSQFTARTSHELRTPLSAIIVFADLALREAYGPLSEKMRNAQQHIGNSARHLKRIINDLLDLSKIEAGEFEIHEIAYPLEQITNVIESTCHPIANEKGLEWTLTVDKTMPAILKGDAERVSQIAVNLAGNAVKFTDEGQVEVDIEPVDKNHWHIIVRDTGPGIPEDQQEMVFEAFRSLDKRGSKSVAKSTGLGLAIARNLAQMMGGDITLESQLGVGSTFEVRLPLVIPEKDEEPIAAAA